ncbi:hypothetical protein NIES2119_26450 [[Phormidium ambiguum] IAM M-71]|uniref:Uncharacterized protein n=1 Tax=[Phormidium ambiguum] IAM M-71 TaxID=454136 RepID=A0A1U7I7N2_9CYAN|nr:hypothetical protein [Phormidium ambiguum]OKH32378.1 hypothetical protein NIES2119_26450 [Phormidium ambiguum IAM M-71]
MENKNELREERNELAHLDYRDWLSKTINELNGEAGAKTFTLKKDKDGRLRLIVDVHSFATHIAKIKEIKLPLEKGERTYRATINLTDGCREVFGEKIQEIKTVLLKRLSKVIRETLEVSPKEEKENYQEIIDRLIELMLVPLTAIPEQASLFSWQFPQISGLSSQELTLDFDSSTPTIRSHKVTIEISNATQFREFILTALDGYIRFLQGKSDLGEADYVIKNVRTTLESMRINGSDELLRLEKLINQETIGRLKREAEINYLEYWAKIIGDDCDEAGESIQKEVIYHYSREGEEKAREISLHEASFYLRDYSRRFKLLENFISNKPDDFDVTYQGVTVNLKELFSKRDAFSELPLVGKIDGCMGETDDPIRSLTSITLGLKFKLNGRVNNPEPYPSSFAYGLDIINPDSELHNKGLTETTPEERKRHAEKIIKFFVLYYFAFACSDPYAENYHYEQVLDFDVVKQFTEKVLQPLSKQSPESDADKKSLMRGFFRGMSKYLVSHKIESIVLILKKYLKQGKLLLSEEREVNIGLSQKLLLQELSEISNTSRFFTDDLYSENLKECLKYVFISPQGASKDAIIQFPVKLQFETDNFYRTGQKWEFNRRYQTGNIQMLPVFYKFVIQDTEKQFNRDKRNVQQLNSLLRKTGKTIPKNASEASEYMSRLVFSGSVIEFEVGEIALENETDSERFIYELTWRTIGLIIIEILTAKAKRNNDFKNWFVAQWILHETAENQTTQQETLIHNITEEWSHILSDYLLMNTQGIVMPKLNNYKITNAKNSLYSVLPQEYCSNNSEKRVLDKLLIVMVSSNKCDARSSRWGENYIANLTGEIVAVERTNTAIKVSRAKTLAYNCWGDELHRSPKGLRNAISYMYHKQGFRDILYIAQTPFSEHLRVTDQQNELFFMSPEIIKFIQEIADDLVIYPVLYDSYSALRIDSEIKEETLYVQDVRQLSNVFNDPNRSQVVFFNLFTGKTIEPERTFYNTVTTYSTLLNAHPGDVLDMNKIMDGLIKDGQLKDDIMFYLTLLHYSRYQKFQSQKKSPNNKEQSFLKLDPLDDIIGDNAIGRASAKGRHCIPSTQINYLAFLTEVYNGLLSPISGENAINNVTNPSENFLSFFEEIENYLANNEVSDPPNELPKNYNDFLVASYNNPSLKQRVNSILKKYEWEIVDGLVDVPF